MISVFNYVTNFVYHGIHKPNPRCYAFESGHYLNFCAYGQRTMYSELVG